MVVVCAVANILVVFVACFGRGRRHCLAPGGHGIHLGDGCSGPGLALFNIHHVMDVRAQAPPPLAIGGPELAGIAWLRWGSLPCRPGAGVYRPGLAPPPRRRWGFRVWSPLACHSGMLRMPPGPGLFLGGTATHRPLRARAARVQEFTGMAWLRHPRGRPGFWCVLREACLAGMLRLALAPGGSRVAGHSPPSSGTLFDLAARWTITQVFGQHAIWHAPVAPGPSASLSGTATL